MSKELTDLRKRVKALEEFFEFMYTTPESGYNPHMPYTFGFDFELWKKKKGKRKGNEVTDKERTDIMREHEKLLKKLGKMTSGFYTNHDD